MADLIRAKWNVGATAAVIVLLFYLGTLCAGLWSAKLGYADVLQQTRDLATFVFVYLWGQASASSQPGSTH